MQELQNTTFLNGHKLQKLKIIYILWQVQELQNATFLNGHKLQKLKIISILWQKRSFLQSNFMCGHEGPVKNSRWSALYSRAHENCCVKGSPQMSPK